MSIPESLQEPDVGNGTSGPKKRVLAFIDGFNLYHSLDQFDHGIDEEDRRRYRKYRWLCVASLVKRFIAPKNEMLIGVEYFTTYPTWSESKRLRHQTYVSALKLQGVQVTLGEFKPKIVTCRASCGEPFQINVEKQTDINIATAMIDRAGEYDKLLLLTADSDQIPAIKLLKKLHPEKSVAMIFPIGRGGKELKKACDNNSYKITESHLQECQLPQLIPIMRDGKQIALLIKPATW